MLLEVNTALVCIRRLCHTFQQTNARTAGILIIGDEILKGTVIDINSPYLVKKLYSYGVRVKKISVISDDVEDISKEVKHFSDTYTYVITSGGIGPTHDDVTFEAVGKAFNEQLVPHPILVDICSKYYNTRDLSSPGMKLAHIPKSAKLTFGEIQVDGKTNYPNVSLRNVYIFPGIPQLLRKLFDQLGHKLFTSKEKFHTRVVYFNVTEKSLLEILNYLVTSYPKVIFGSYPEMENSMYKVRITLEAVEECELEEAYEKLIELMPKEYIVQNCTSENCKNNHYVH